MRPDILKSQRMAQKGLRMVLATNGTLVDNQVARKMINSGIQRVSISIDGKDTQSHDVFRAEQGAFAERCAALKS